LTSIFLSCIFLLAKLGTGNMQDRKHELLETFKHYYKVTNLIAVLGDCAYLKSHPSQPVEFVIYPLVITMIKCRQYAIFPPLYGGRLTCELRGDFAHSRIGEGSLRRGNKTSTVYN